MTEKDIEFHYCGNPSKAVRVADEVRPTVIMQDLVMPDIDGLILMIFFRVNPATREAPRIMLSSCEEPLIKALASALRANDHLVKWPDKGEQIARLCTHVKLLKGNDALDDEFSIVEILF